MGDLQKSTYNFVGANQSVCPTQFKYILPPLLVNYRYAAGWFDEYHGRTGNCEKIFSVQRQRRWRGLYFSGRRRCALRRKFCVHHR
ncbi:MAG: hypothetical protein HWN66_03915 [Candidatus Helarchaeota archaeon]|nr:hypothetical protein [Candidatus Helarchaeota archaeon]